VRLALLIVLQRHQPLMHQIQGVVDQPSSIFAGHGALPNSAKVLEIPKPRVRSPEHDSAHRQKSRTNRKKASTTDHQHWDPCLSCLKSCLNQNPTNPEHPQELVLPMQDLHNPGCRVSGITTRYRAFTPMATYRRNSRDPLE
jgi:hypothetical protein